MMIFQAVMSHTNQTVSYPYQTGTMTADLWLSNRWKLWYPGCDNLLAHCFTVFIQFPEQLPSGGAIVIQIFIWFPWKTGFIITMITRNPWKPGCDLNNHSTTLTALCYFDTVISKTVCYSGCMDLSVQTHYPSYIHFYARIIYWLMDACLSAYPTEYIDNSIPSSHIEYTDTSVPASDNDYWFAITDASKCKCFDINLLHLQCKWFCISLFMFFAAITQPFRFLPS